MVNFGYRRGGGARGGGGAAAAAAEVGGHERAAGGSALPDRLARTAAPGEKDCGRDEGRPPNVRAGGSGETNKVACRCGAGP